jgi:hypothetical protein
MISRFNLEECRLLGYKTPVRTSQETHYVTATEPTRLMLCKIWGFHGGNYEERRPLGYYYYYYLIRYSDVIYFRYKLYSVYNFMCKQLLGHRVEERLYLRAREHKKVEYCSSRRWLTTLWRNTVRPSLLHKSGVSHWTHWTARGCHQRTGRLSGHCPDDCQWRFPAGKMSLSSVSLRICEMTDCSMNCLVNNQTFLKYLLKIQNSFKATL